MAPLGGWARSHPSYSAPLEAESTSVFAGWLPWQPSKAGCEAGSFPSTDITQGHDKDSYFFLVLHREELGLHGGKQEMNAGHTS